MNQILVKKKSMAEENENLIKYVDLNGSIISTDDLNSIADKSRDNDDAQPRKFLENWSSLAYLLEVFNFVKDIDIINEKRPLFKRY